METRLMLRPLPLCLQGQEWSDEDPTVVVSQLSQRRWHFRIYTNKHPHALTIVDTLHIAELRGTQY